MKKHRDKLKLTVFFYFEKTEGKNFDCTKANINGPFWIGGFLEGVNRYKDHETVAKLIQIKLLQVS